MKLKKLFLFALLPLLVGCVETTENGGNNGGSGGEIITPDPTPKTYDWKYSITFADCGYVDESKVSGELKFTDSIKFTYDATGSSSKTTKYYEPKVHFYSGNKFSVKSNEEKLTKIVLSFGANDGTNEIETSVGNFDDDTWTGEAKEIQFEIKGSSGHRSITAVEIHFNKDVAQPEEEVIVDPTATNLGEKTISEVKEYITNHPVNKNAFGNGVDKNTLVTIKGFALAKIDLVKQVKAFGLDVSYSGKVIMADSTGSIGVATNKSGDGTTLWGKVGDYVAKDTSKYVITGFISEYLGHPEITVTSFSWDQSLNISWSADTLSEETVSLTQFYEESVNTLYNCAGNGYGKVVTINNLTCYYSESDGSGKRYYNFTDGTKSIRVNAFNMPSVSVGHVYNVTGIISLKDYSPIIVAFNFTNSQETPTNLDYSSVSTDISVASFRTIKGSQDDTNEKYPNLIKAFGTFYKTTGYLVVVKEDGKYYIGLSDTYYNHVLTGKNSAKANGVLLIKNSNFWNVTEIELELFNSYYQDYIFEEVSTTLYYVPRQIGYEKGSVMWEILLVPSSIPEMIKG